jgi:hypothetical protein
MLLTTLSEGWVLRNGGLHNVINIDLLLPYLQNRQFIRIVDKLEGLVVQRLFELSKSHLAGTGNLQLHPQLGFN